MYDPVKIEKEKSFTWLEENDTNFSIVRWNTNIDISTENGEPIRTKITCPKDYIHVEWNKKFDEKIHLLRVTPFSKFSK